MTKRVKQLEEKIKLLSKEELESFRKWFLDFDSDEWDAQIENDLRSGALQHLVDNAKADYESGNARKL